GRVIHGEAFDRFGITKALGGDANDHGPNGVLDVTGNLLRTGNPVGTHDTHGWPTFAGWPTFDTNTHQQAYYVWLKRMWMAGMRILVAQVIEDEPLCRLEPLRSHSCNETETVKLSVARLRGLQDYVDAQSGGRGRGWLKLVSDPRSARQAIEQGKLAVLIGVESSNPFGCSVFRGLARCTRDDVDRGIALYRSLGISGMFITHWVDNAFAGAALEGGDKGLFISTFEVIQTGSFFATEQCPEAGQGEEPQATLPAALAGFFEPLGPVLAGNAPVYPPGKQCNARGLTPLGEYVVKRLMDNHMLIEADHLSEKARLRVLDMAEARHYPLVSSHTGTGGPWSDSTLRRLFKLGGFATATPAPAAQLANSIRHFEAYRAKGKRLGVGIGTDTGGFSSLPGPDTTPGHVPLPYPFRSYDGHVTFERQRTGDRVFDYNRDGVAHYGLFADLLADTARQPGGEEALRLLFRSAEAYLRMWERAAI
ncbi:MAG: hypothetical protein QOI98_2732, partial [Solirubrobacteraceae bacterium]|nr:hypothetical protein [Solirubrobacteraceae bacterium]